MKKTLRLCQRESIDALYDAWKIRNDRYLIVLPTGTGKSLTLSALIFEMWEKYGEVRTLILHPTKELIAQNYLEFTKYAPYLDAGVYSAGLKRKDINAPILFAGIQSIYKHVHKLDPAPQLIIVDECHTIPRESDTMYQKCLTVLKLMNPDLSKVGFTATNFRLNCGYLHLGDDKIFDSIVYEYPIQQAIDDGYLSPITAKAGSETIDTSKVHKRGGEFVESELQKVAMSGDITREAVADVISKSHGRKKWLVFATGIDHAEQIKEEIEKYGISCETVTGKTPNRDRVIKDYKDGEIQCLININILMTGFNVPEIDLIVWLRPTQSPVLWVQGNGRGTRLFPGKENCLVLDYSGNGLRLGPIDAVQVYDKRSKGDGVAPAKLCDDCEAIVAAGARKCPLCGFEFPEPKPELYDNHKEAPILKSHIQPEWIKVNSTSLHVHKKQGKKDSVRVQYQCGVVTHSEWIFPEASNQSALFYFMKFCKSVGIEEIYNTSTEMVDNASISIDKILIKPDGKYIKIIDRVLKDKESIVTVEQEEYDTVPLF